MNDGKDEREKITTKASEQIIQDMEDIVIDKEHYETGINGEFIKESTSNFMIKILAKVFTKLDNTLTELLICSLAINIIEGQVTFCRLL